MRARCGRTCATRSWRASVSACSWSKSHHRATRSASPASRTGRRPEAFRAVQRLLVAAEVLSPGTARADRPVIVQSHAERRRKASDPLRVNKSDLDEVSWPAATARNRTTHAHPFHHETRAVARCLATDYASLEKGSSALAQPPGTQFVKTAPARAHGSGGMEPAWRETPPAPSARDLRERSSMHHDRGAF